MLEGHNLATLEIHSKSRIEQVTEGSSNYTWNMWLCEVPDALQGCDWASYEMHLKVVMLQN